MTIKKLSRMPYAQAHTETDTENTVTLFSYVTRVATLTNDGWLTTYGLYSMTTRKHISAFLKEYCTPVDYQMAKKCYEDGCQINIFTGEVVELA